MHISGLKQRLPAHSYPRQRKAYTAVSSAHQTVIFDGDVSGVARFRLFTDHFYPKAVLVLRHLTTGGEEEEDYSQFPLYFERFSHVYIFKDIPQAKVFSHENVIWVDNHDFIKELDFDVAIFYHYGSYYRKYKEFRLEYLEEEII